MEILIHIPSFLHSSIEFILRYWTMCMNAMTYLHQSVIQLYQTTWLPATTTTTTTVVPQTVFSTSILSSYTSNVIIPIVAVLLVFWPILLSFIMAVVTAWAWIIWLLTSILLGMIQIVYASYQFVMIFIDICGISILKTYAIVVRSRFFYLLIDHKGNRHQKMSRRKIWWQRLEQAKKYEDFLNIRIESKHSSVHHHVVGRTGHACVDGTWSITSNNNNNNKRGFSDHSDSSSIPKRNGTFDDDDNDDCTDTALPPRNSKRITILGRSNSFTSSRLLTEESPSKTVMLRNLSFSGSVPTTSTNDNTNNHSHQHDMVYCHDPMTIQEIGRQTADLLVTTTYRLERSRLACMEHHHPNRHDDDDDDDDDGDIINNSNNNSRNNNNNTYAEALSTMQYLLAGVVKRNHLQLDELLVQNARSIAEMGSYGLSKHTRHIIKSYYQEVEKCLDYIADAPIQQQQQLRPLQSIDIHHYQHHRLSSRDLYDRITLLRKMKQNMGRTALMLSGGGAQAMYHLGVVKALIESKLYNDIKVISGTSGGSITAAMCAVKTAEELHTHVCVNTVSTDFMLSGEMKKQNIRWFPPMYDMATYWIKHKLLVDSAYFGRTCEFYFKDFTFEEAFVRTGKHVCITVSASRASGTTAQRLLLNHISTPHVTIASAVRASCALPGVMAPAKLIVKSSSGVLEPFEVDGVEWIDGSVQADLPFQRIATLFAITSFIVSQTNFHVVPFLNKEHHPDNKSFYWKLFQTIEWDIRSRALKLSRLGLFPRIFGQDVSKVFKQKYHGNLTIVPRFTTMQTFGLKALSNPTVKDMDGYLKYSQIATWPYLNAIRDMICLEKALDDCLARLEGRIRSMNPESDWSAHDEIESIESSSVVATNSGHRVRIIGRPSSQPNGPTAREAEHLRRKVSGLERENQQLREELDRLQSNVKSNSNQEETNELIAADYRYIDTDKVTLSDGSEGEVWNLVRSAGTCDDVPPPSSLH